MPVIAIIFINILGDCFNNGDNGFVTSTLKLVVELSKFPSEVGA